mmetsp:Transcript_15313/g.35304  ORF Transcript_15313/g.35304 Transcript_15313/m.35304 type:complete len:102 (-) Transcript_15313:311-616(-)
MALTLLNHFFWQIPDAKVPFMIADAVIVVALRYVEKGIEAQNKLREIEEQHAEQNHQMDKEQKLAQKQATRQQQHKMANANKQGGGGGSGGKKQNFNIKSD